MTGTVCKRTEVINKSADWAARGERGESSEEAVQSVESSCFTTLFLSVIFIHYSPKGGYKLNTLYHCPVHAGDTEFLVSEVGCSLRVLKLCSSVVPPVVILLNSFF